MNKKEFKRDPTYQGVKKDSREFYEVLVVDCVNRSKDEISLTTLRLDVSKFVEVEKYEAFVKAFGFCISRTKSFRGSLGELDDYFYPLNLYDLFNSSSSREFFFDLIKSYFNNAIPFSKSTVLTLKSPRGTLLYKNFHYQIENNIYYNYEKGIRFNAGHIFTKKTITY